jgi:radical SAM superfamily enzyme YgiQ (UPF0313 family)
MIALINHQGLKVMEGIQLQSPSPPIGLAYLGAFLKENGFSYTAIDACGLGIDKVNSYKDSDNIYIQGLTNQEVVDRIPNNTKVIAFTCLFSHCWPLVSEMAEEARKKFPEAVFVLGGEHGTALPELVLNHSVFDIIVYGEGEETFLELVRNIKLGQDWKHIDGIYFKDIKGQLVKNNPRMRITDVDRFPYPDWDSWCIEKYIQQGQVTGINLGRSIPFLASRGCPYDCKFCSNDQMWTKRYIMRGGKDIVDEMEYFKKKYNLDGFTFMDLTFVVNRKKTKEFARELIDRGLNISYQLPAGTRCEAFDKELVELLEKSGLKNFAFAPEAGDEHILAVTRKKVKIEKFFETVKLVLNSSKMTMGCFFVIGFPEDTHETIKKTLKMVRRLAFIGVHDVTISQFTPYPGSDYFKELRDAGRITTNMNDLSKIINFYSTDGKSYSNTLSFNEVNRWMFYIYLNFYILSFILRPWRVFKNFWDFFTKEGVENTRYMRLFSELFVKRKKWEKAKS